MTAPEPSAAPLPGSSSAAPLPGPSSAAPLPGPSSAAPLPGPSSAAPSPGPRPPAATQTSPVAAAVARLGGVHQLPLHEQPDAFQAVHTELQNALAAIDDA